MTLPTRLAAIDRAAQLHAEGWGYRRIARELGITRDEARRLVGARCPGCGVRMSRGAERCRRCSPAAARKQAGELLDAPLATHVPRAEAAAFAALCRAEGLTVSEVLRRYVRARLAEGPGAGPNGKVSP